MAAAGNNRFAVTCGLLRQYMRENKQQQSQQQIGGPFLPPPAQEAMEEADARTTQFFPTQARTSHKTPEQEATAPLPLTIFYNGRVLVFEDFPADKAKELIQLAASVSSPALKDEVPVAAQKPVATGPSSLPSDLPIARKASLKRFLQKRKHRIIAADPYHNNETPTGKEAAESKQLVHGGPAASWLAL